MNGSNIPYNNRVIYYGEVIDEKDPLGLGRVRAILKTENTTDREVSASPSNDAGISENDKWTSRDPFVVRPLLPIYINTIPKEKEFIHLIYSNSDDKSNRDKFYVGGVHSSLTTIKNEPYESAVKNSNLGSRDAERKKLRKPGTTEEYDSKTKGVYSLPQDISIDGRGSSDIIVKEDTVLLRAGKFNTDPKPNTYPIANDNRAFLQLSKFDEVLTYGPPNKTFKFKFNHKPVKVLVEYNIQNPENNSNSYTGSIYIYNLKPTEKTGTQNLTLSSDVEDEKSLFLSFSFIGITKNKIIELVNSIINGVSEGLIPYLNDITPNVSPKGPYRIDLNLSLPLYYRPQPSLYNKLNSDNSTTAEKLFISSLMSGIKSSQSEDFEYGYGLIYDETKRTTVPFVPEENTVIPKNYLPINTTASLLGSDYVYLLSHKSAKKGAGKINLSNTIYGIDNRVTSDEIEPKTSSVVRGEELIDLLNLIVQFLITHVHPYHGMKPDSQSLNGITVDKLLEELRNANEKILNKYIRIN